MLKTKLFTLGHQCVDKAIYSVVNIIKMVNCKLGNEI